MPNKKQNTEYTYTLSPALPDLLLDWYDRNARALPWRRDNDPYRVWISEVMLQQTGVEAVKKYYARFLAAVPTVRVLAEIDEQALLKLWEGLGYYSRARNLRKAAQLIVREHRGIFPHTYESIAALPGIGPYTAGAIASICFEAPTPAVDGNVIRVVARIEGIDDVISDKVKKCIAAALADIYPHTRRGDFTQSLMELGATVCVPNSAPKCGVCPAADLCDAKKTGTASMLPVKTPKAAKRSEQLTVFILKCGERLALRRRVGSGLLPDLWELPNLPGSLSDTEAVAAAARWGTEPLALLKSSERSHIFTHIRWTMTCYFIDCRAEAPGFVWASPDELRDTYPLPTAFRKCLDAEANPN
jgi:A/G-specific adenine glycosylase